MSAKTLAQVLLRVLGILLIVWGLGFVGTVVLFFAPSAGPAGAMRAGAMATLFPLVVYIAAGIFLVLNGDRLGAWLVRDSSDGQAPAAAIDAYAVGMRLLGIYFIVAGCRDLAGSTAQLFAYPQWDETSRFMLLFGRGALGAVVELVAGAILLFRKR